MKTKRFYREIAGSAARFRALLPQARTIQRLRLRAILDRNGATEYGRRYGFGEIEDEASYRSRVPMVAWEDLEPYVERMARGEADVLVPGRPIAFEETGGSTRGPKLVPYTAAALDAFRAALLPWLDDLASAWPEIAAGRAYWAISPAARRPRETAGGIAVGLGSDAAYFGDRLAPHLLETLAVPPAVGAIADIEAWRDATCEHLMACEDLALVSVWSPTFLSGLLAHLRAHGERLYSNLAGAAAESPSAARLARVREWLQSGDLSVLWPGLRVVSCWEQGAAKPYAGALRDELPDATLQGKGLLATEGVVTIPLGGMPMPVLAVDSGYYEFLDDTGACRGASDLTSGERYQVVMTTESGLYRYALGDRVRVHGYAGEAPMLEFLGRSGLCVDLCGEKLTEDFVLAALAPLRLKFSLLAPRASPRCGYLLHVDAEEVLAHEAAGLGRAADAALAANPQYAYARKLAQLEAIEVHRSTRPLAVWFERGTRQGRRLGDIKPPVLSPDHEWQARLARAP